MQPDEPGQPSLGRLLIHGEFASVELWVDNHANGCRLAILDRKTDRVGFLDALELEALAWSRHHDLKNILDPGRVDDMTSEFLDSDLSPFDEYVRASADEDGESFSLTLEAGDA